MIKAQRLKKPRRPLKQWSKANWETIREETGKFRDDFLQDCEQRDVKTNYKAFVDHIDDVISSHVPTKMSSSRQNVPWMTPAIRRMTKKKQRLGATVQRERTRTNIGLSTGHTRTTQPKLYGRLIGITIMASCRPAWTMGTLSHFGGTYLANRTTSQGLRCSKRTASSAQEVRRRLKFSTANSALYSLPTSQRYRPLSLDLPTRHSGSWL